MSADPVLDPALDRLLSAMRPTLGAQLRDVIGEVEQRAAQAAEQAAAEAVRAVTRAREEAAAEAAHAMTRAREEAVAESARALARAREDAAAEVAAVREAAARDLEAARSAADADRRASEARLEAVRVESDEQRRDLEGRLAHVHDRLEAARRDLEAGRVERQAEREAGRERHRRLAEAFDRLAGADTLGAILDLLGTDAAREAERVAVLVVRDGQLRDVSLSGFGGDERPRGQRVQVPLDQAGIVARAVRDRRPAIATDADSGAGSDRPAFAAGGDRRAVAALPLVVGGRAVGVVYADSRARADDPVWPGGLDLLVRHASLLLETRTVEYAAGVRAPRTGPAVPTA